MLLQPIKKVGKINEEDFQENFKNLVDIVVNGGSGGIVPSTVIDCTTDEPVMLREGLGQWIT